MLTPYAEVRHIDQGELSIAVYREEGRLLRKRKRLVTELAQVANRLAEIESERRTIQKSGRAEPPPPIQPQRPAMSPDEVLAFRTMNLELAERARNALRESRLSRS